MVDLGKRREVEVKIPLVPERALMSPGPGVALRETWGWDLVLLGALRSEEVLAALAAAVGWEVRGTYRTSLWCAEEDVPSAPNLNLYGGSKSHVSWHCCDEPLFWKKW